MRLTDAVKAALAIAGTTSVTTASAATWTDWSTATIGVPGSASGTLLTGVSSSVTVSYSGELIGQTNVSGGGTNYWRSDAAYCSALVENGPGENGNSDIIALNGQSTSPLLMNTITFSQPVVDPVMAILSLGRPNVPVTYTFDADFTILSSGSGWFGGQASGSLFRDAPGVLRGLEGHGVIVFSGTFTSISFTAGPAEFWHGFQIGVVPGPSAMFGVVCAAMIGLRRRR
ncbi:MAG TPA: hypothetical protein VK157_08185 [Phycisphaerales bacterium]|nr:hypothetical protein [Phycisphaerales bacterium]